MHPSLRAPLAGLTTRDLLVGAIATAWFSARIGRSYRYDESVTVGSFVEVDSLVAALTQQNNFNNHPGMTATAHLVHRLGVGDAATYRLFALACAVVAVVALHRAVVGWISPVAGLVAASVLTVHPELGDHATQVRGYAPMVAFVTLASIDLINARRNHDETLRRRYYVFVALAVAFHLYAILPLAAHGLVTVLRRRPGWIDVAVRTTMAGGVGLVPYLGVARTMLVSSGDRSSVFQPSLPLDVAVMTLGDAPVAAVLLGVGAALGLFGLLRLHPDVRVAAFAVVTSFAAIWLALAPRDTYPRMWLWLVPGIAVALGALAERSRWSRPVIAAGLAIIVAASIGDVMSTDRNSEVIGEQLAALQQNGWKTCGVAYSGEPFLAYTEVEAITSLPDLDACDVIVSHPAFESHFIDLDLHERVRVTGSSLDRYLIGWTEPVHASVPWRPTS